MATAYGTVSDLYAPENRGGALGFVSSMATVGPLVGPILGGFIATAWGWRATFLATASLGGLFLILHMLFGAETFRDVKRWDGGAADSVETDGDEGIAVDALRSSGEGAGTEVDYSEIPKGECRQLVVETESDATGVSTTAANKKQLHPLLVVFRLLGVDFVLFTSLCAAVGFSVMFAIQTIMPILFLEVYDFNASQTGLSYLAGGFMNAVSALVAGRTSDYFYKRARQQRMKRARGAQLESATGNENEHGMPEDRFTPWTFVNSFFIVPFGTILFGWSIYARVHIGVPIAAFGFVCFGFTDSVLTSSAYLVDATAAYGRASSATSAANLFRMVLACVLSVIATPWVRAIGVQWLCTLFAGLSVLSGLGLLGLKWAGPKMRARSSSVFAKSSNPKQ
ncbi:major facilitator superfamily domain-containing protein [Cladochytrium replicatum]|nr:major facilitator superfamily domain-containing protein [Cladochytrium replicatum]